MGGGKIPMFTVMPVFVCMCETILGGHWLKVFWFHPQCIYIYIYIYIYISGLAC